MEQLKSIKKIKSLTNLTYALHSGVYYNDAGFSNATKIDVNVQLLYNDVKYNNIKDSEVTDQKQNHNNFEIYNSINNNISNKLSDIIYDKEIKSKNKAVNTSVNTKQEQTKETNTVEKIKSSTVNKVKKASTIIKAVNTSLRNLSNKNSYIFLRGWVRMTNNKIIPRNFGDDINFTFLPNITGLTHHLYDGYNSYVKNYLMIGSVFIDKYINSKTEIWGTGMLKPRRLKNKPAKVYAVRGPKTREIALKSGIDCPAIYGDPALLLPYYYYPYVHKKYKLGIIPHHSHINTLLVLKFKKDNSIKVINFVNYSNWKDIIKLILQCEFIVSESLHGLIISETYRIPNIWVSFDDIDLNFKYEDFFLSVGKKPYDSFKITNNTTVEDLLKLKENYDPIFNIDLKKLVNACPVKLNNLSMDNVIKPYTNKVLLCCIGKMENNYIKEFVDYYRDLGFDNICLYDNNDEDGEKFEDVIKEDIDNGFVILKNWRGKLLALIPAYTDCYNTYKDEYDWIAYFDIDEFLHINNNKSIKEFLSNDKFNDRGINCVRVCWKLFTDSNIIKTNGDYSVKKFTLFLPISNYLASGQSKCIIKTLFDKLEFSSPHGPLTDTRVKAVNTAGELCQNSIMMNNRTWEGASLYHYRFKTIEEYVLAKMVRLWPTKYLGGGKKGLTLEFFFKFNEKSKEKMDYARYLLDKYNISKNN